MNRRLAPPVAALLFLLVGGACGSAPPRTSGTSDPGSQARFGVEMARRGLWNEALFRFEQAHRERPTDARLLNDLAISYEAVGRFDDADDAYAEAVRAEPGNRQIRSNYTKFREFYQNYRPPEATSDEGGDESPAAPAGASS